MTTGTFHTKVVGVSESNANGSSRQNYIRSFAKAGMPLILKREPNNPHDPNAVAIWLKARAFLFATSEVQIGYLSEILAAEISQYLEKGGKVDATIAEVTGGGRGKPTHGVNILIQKG